MINEYAKAIEVVQLAPGEYAGLVTEGWQVGGATFGGYLLSLAASAIRADLADFGHSDPFALTAYFLSPVDPGEVKIRVGRLRRGGRTSTVSASLTQNVDGVDVQRFSVLATFGALSSMSGDEVLADKPPIMPAFEDCLPTWRSPNEVKQFVQIMDRFDLRLDPACAQWSLSGKPSGLPFVQGWFQHKDGAVVDTIDLLSVADALPPVPIDLLGTFGWAPTLELSAYVRAVPAPGPLRVRHETKTFAGGFFEEDCVIFDSEDRLVAQSRQLALQPRPVA